MLYQNIRKIRLVSNFKQEYVADQLGISQPEYSKIENGKRVPNADNLRRLCNLYNVPVSVFFSNEQANQVMGIESLIGKVPSEEQLRESIRHYLEKHSSLQFNGDKQEEVAQMVFRSFMEFVAAGDRGFRTGMAS